MGFLFTGASAQHQAILQRGMRFGTLAAINLVSNLLSVALAVAMAVVGFGYWALVVMTISAAAISMVGVWLATGWVPSRPERQSGIRSMLKFGGTLTLNGLVVYLAFNADKILLGRIWGAEVLGIYGRAFSLVNLPTESLTSTIGAVAFPALSRLQNDPARLRSYFIKGYSLFLSLALPVSFWCALFADDIILVMLGPKWREAAIIFRLLTPTTIVFALANPFSWLMMGNGQAGRLFKIGLMATPVILLGYILGLSDGARGVAMGFSFAMVLVLMPVVLWAKHGSLITLRDVFVSAIKPSVAIVVGLASAVALNGLAGLVRLAVLRLFVESCVFFGVYLLVLLFGMGQKAIYMGLLRETGLWRRKIAEPAPSLEPTI
jgi:PST family polysaccharide transporter